MDISAALQKRIGYVAIVSSNKELSKEQIYLYQRCTCRNMWIMLLLGICKKTARILPFTALSLLNSEPSPLSIIACFVPLCANVLRKIRKFIRG